MFKSSVFLFLLFCFTFSSSIFACSFVKAPFDSGCITARSMDYEDNISLPMVYSVPRTKNISNVNSVPNLADDNIKKWETIYKFIGTPLSTYGDVVDGINEHGLYCGYLYLPGITKFPEYNSGDTREAIAYFNLPAFLLGTCDSVAKALEELEKVQILGSALEPVKYKPFRKVGAAVFPLHLVMADKNGNSALIEFIDGKVQIHKDGENGFDLNVVTNSPRYEWHVNDYKETSKDFTPENTDRKWDGLYMNGSGFAGKEHNAEGIPGDWTPPSRFNRATAILEYSPKAKTVSQAFYIAEQAINSVCVPIGMNVAPTNWISMANLAEGKYYFKKLQTIMVSVPSSNIKAIVPDSPHPYTYKEYSVNDFKPLSIDGIKSIRSKIKRSGIKVDYQKLYNKMLNPKSPVGEKYNADFISVTPNQKSNITKESLSPTLTEAGSYETSTSNDSNNSLGTKI